LLLAIDCALIVGAAGVGGRLKRIRLYNGILFSNRDKLRLSPSERQSFNRTNIQSFAIKDLDSVLAPHVVCTRRYSADSIVSSRRNAAPLRRLLTGAVALLHRYRLRIARRSAYAPLRHWTLCQSAQCHTLPPQWRLSALCTARNVRRNVQWWNSRTPEYTITMP
jgi:hypothetical protein